MPAPNSPGIPTDATVRLTGGNITVSSHSFADLTGATLTVVTGSHRCLVVFSAIGANNTNAQDISLDIAIDGTRQGGTFGLVAAGVGANLDTNYSFSYLTDVLSAGSHTIKIQALATGSSTGTIYASATAPTILSVIELAY